MMPRLGFRFLGSAWPQALLYSLALGPHPQRELTLMLALGFPWPRARMAAGALSVSSTYLPYLPYPPYS